MEATRAATPESIITDRGNLLPVPPPLPVSPSDMLVNEDFCLVMLSGAVQLAESAQGRGIWPVRVAGSVSPRALGMVVRGRKGLPCHCTSEVHRLG